MNCPEGRTRSIRNPTPINLPAGEVAHTLLTLMKHTLTGASTHIPKSFAGAIGNASHNIVCESIKLPHNIGAH